MNVLDAVRSRRPDIPTLLVIVSGLALLLGVVRSSPGLVETLAVDGPNSLGEAGKVYFARRFADGQSIFADGLTRPYYPSVHGPLIHVVVGAFGRGGISDPGTYYLVGRGLSMILAVGALVACAALLRNLGASGWWAAGIAGVYMVTPRLASHLVSYRPDYWLLCLSTLACWLVARQGRSTRALALLSAIPTLAFLTKATGLALLPAIVFGLLAAGEPRRALGVGAASAGILLAAVAALQLLSGGEFLIGLRSGVRLSYSLRQALESLSAPAIWIPLAAPLVLGWRLSGKPVAESGRTWRVVLAFWGWTFAAAFASSFRIGSDAYYFLEPATYGLLICLAWVENTLRAAPAGSARARAAVLILAIVLLTNPLAAPAENALVHASEVHAPYRRPIAEYVNAHGLKCFSSDPGLNVFLDDPAVIHPTVQTTFVAAGRLDPSSFFAPLRAQEYDLVLLAEFEHRFRNISSLPDGYRDSLSISYRRIPSQSPYEIYVPRRHPRAEEALPDFL